jgi:iron complex outermembrane receptor protein
MSIVCFAITQDQTHAQQEPSAQPSSPAEQTSFDPVSDDLDDILSLAEESLESLSAKDVIVPQMDVVVSTVSRTESTVGRSPAAVYVLTNEMIRRSGARNIPEALRLVPGVQVARINANTYAISIRGFNQQFANKLLVQIDGRTVYTPLFAGVFWDVQDVLLEDVERIEIIRGPGATVWGANAVNGVINVITKRAQDTQGLFVEGGGGNERGFASARIGGQSGDFSWRTYGKWFDRDAGLSLAGNASDDWQMGRFGFRTDWQPNRCDTITFQGDYYDGDAGQFLRTPTAVFPFVQTGPQNKSLAGGNALVRWSRQIDEDSDWSLQFYYDRTERTLESTNFRENRDTVDVDFQYRFGWSDYHSIIWGFGYRNTRDKIRNAFGLRFLPTDRADDRFSFFVQDKMTLLDDRLYFTVGSKFSWNDYTGFEIQPTARLLYTPSERQTAWASVSRAVRVPSRAADDLLLLTPPTSVPIFPTFSAVQGNRNNVSEQLLSWEMGIREAPTDNFYWDLAVFYNQYKDLSSIMPGLPGIDPITGVFAVPLNLVNGQEAETYGCELASTWQINRCWTMRGAYSFLRIDLLSGDTAGTEGSSPRNQFFIHSSWDLGCDWEFDLIGRYVDTLTTDQIPSYFEMDTRLAWRPTDSFEFAVVGRNLLDRAHSEFGDDVFTGLFAAQMQREVYGMVTLRY